MKNKIFTIIVLFAFFTIFFFINPTYTGYITYEHIQPDIELNLTETEYNVGEYIDGTINLSLNGPIKAYSKVILDIDGEKDELTIIEILLDLNKQYEIEGGDSVKDDETKVLEFTKAETKKLFTKISSQLDKFSFDITGSVLDNSYPTPTIDILEDNIPDYIYLGTRSTDYKSDKIKSSGLDDVTPSDYSITPDHYFCELIELPYAQHFKINIDYTGTGTVNAILLPVDVSNMKASYKPYTCTTSSKSCELTLTKPIQGYHFVCAYTNSDTIKLANEDTDLSNSKGYKCDIQYLNKEGDTAICTPKNLPDSEIRLGDFFITIQVPEYSGELKTKETFNADLDIINNYFTSCTESPCTIPISISSGSKGKITIDNIEIIYGPTTKKYLSEYIETQDIIYKISGRDLSELTTPLTLKIPLSIFYVTIPNITKETKQLTVKASIGEKSDQEKINVSKLTQIISNITITTDLESSLLSYTEKEKEIALLLGYDIDSTLLKIETYNQQKQDILNSTTLTDTEKDSQIALIEQSIENIGLTIPSSLEIITSIKNLPTQRATEIPDAYLLENQRSSSIKQQIINLQSNINIKTDVTAFELTINNVPEQKTLVKKTISGVLTDIYLIEEIPKTIASSTDEIKFSTSNYEVIQSDPIVRWSVTSLPATITYIVSEDILDYYDELITTAIPKQISAEPSDVYKEVVCGDGICTSTLEDKITCPEDCMKKINWWFVIILLALLIGGIYYLNFYKGKMSLKKMTKPQEKPTLFRSKTDEINLRNYVKKSLEHGIPQSRIRTILLAKGWSENQINHIFKTL